MNIIMNWAASHQQFLAGAVLGWASTHPRVIVKALFQAAMKLPALDALVKKNGPALHAWVKEGAEELVQDIDAQALPPAPPPESHQ
jgi:triphosphoribosyl-dephospho-CoA synthetase